MNKQIVGANIKKLLQKISGLAFGGNFIQLTF